MKYNTSRLKRTKRKTEVNHYSIRLKYMDDQVMTRNKVPYTKTPTYYCSTVTAVLSSSSNSLKELLREFSAVLWKENLTLTQFLLPVRFISVRCNSQT